MRWNTIKLGELVTIKHGYAFDGRFFSNSGKYVLLTPGNCYERGGLKLHGEKERYYVGDVPDEYLLHAGDLLVVMTDLVNTAPILGGAFLIPEDDRYLHNQRLGLVETVDPSLIDKSFLYYLLNSYEYRAQVRGSASGATVRHTAPKRIQNCIVRLPLNTEDQAKIAQTLIAYDSSIENNWRRIALLEQAARHLYEEWFGRFRFPGHERVKMSDGLPKGWHRKPACDCMDILSGGTPKTDNSGFWDGKIPFFTPKDAEPSVFVFDTEKHLTERGLKACNSHLYSENTLLITARGTVGKMNLLGRPMAMNQSCYALIAYTPLSQEFLYFAMSFGVKELRSQAGGAVFDAIVRDTFKFISVVVPSEEIVQRFTVTVHPYLMSTANLQAQIRSLQKARDLLLPRLMSGEVEV